MFFQDYIPKNPNYKMHLNLLYGTGLSFGPPQAEKYQDILRIPDYRRVDIGFSAVLKGEKKRSKIRWLNAFNNIWISAEVFNLLDINNTVSYLWVVDITGRQYAVPNYLTSRQLNTKLILNINILRLKIKKNYLFSLSARELLYIFLYSSIFPNSLSSTAILPFVT